jgi:hypothetical protein
MTRRLIATGLWGYFGWFLTATIASALGLSVGLAPIGGAVMVGLALYDWRRLTSRRARATPDRAHTSS